MIDVAAFLFIVLAVGFLGWLALRVIVVIIATFHWYKSDDYGLTKVNVRQKDIQAKKKNRCNKCARMLKWCEC